MGDIGDSEAASRNKALSLWITPPPGFMVELERPQGLSAGVGWEIPGGVAMHTRFVLLLVVVSLLAACGSDGDQLSEEEFLAQANEICRENGQTLGDDTVSNIRGQIDEIRDLNGPSALEDELDPVLDEASEILDRMSGEFFFESEGDEFDELNTQLSAIGLTTCAE
jgi:hypothetical protein